MSIESTRQSNSPQGPTPSAALRRLGEMLVGTWKLSGDAEGQIRFEWMEGGMFLVQHVDLAVFGRRHKGIEILGHLHRVNEEPSAEIWTRFYSFFDGLTLDYVYELRDDTLTIWFGRKNSDNRYTGRFSKDRRSFEGAWQWPGGGYEVKGTKIG
jgi:hypothetical protein